MLTQETASQESSTCCCCSCCCRRSCCGGWCCCCGCCCGCLSAWLRKKTKSKQPSTRSSCCGGCGLLPRQEAADNVQHRRGPGGGPPQEVQPLVMSQVDGEPGQQPQQPLLLRLSDDPATDQAGDQEP